MIIQSWSDLQAVFIGGGATPYYEKLKHSCERRAVMDQMRWPRRIVVTGITQTKTAAATETGTETETVPER